MESYKHRLFGIFSNPPPGEAGHLPYLSQEQAELEQLFGEVADSDDWVFHFNLKTEQHRPDAEIAEIAQMIGKLEKQITLLHYSGHADHTSLILDKQDFRTDSLIQQLARCSRLHVLVLNGCSTQGFVKYVLEHTSVKAVIATDKPVDDKAALHFSRHFYQYLFMHNATLAEAFNMARSVADPAAFTLNENIYKAVLENGTIRHGELIPDKATNGTRGIGRKVSSFLQDGKTRTPWGIYTRSEAILDWKLCEPPPAQDHHEAIISQSIDANRKKVVQLKVAILDKKDTVLPIVELAASQPGNASLAKSAAALQKELDDLTAELAAVEAVIQQQLQEKQELAHDSFDEVIFRTYSQHLSKLNYLDQIDYIHFHQGNAPQVFNGFILQGTPDCCLDHLSRNIQEWLQIRNSTETFLFDFTAGMISDFWEEIRQRKLPGSMSGDPAVIANGFFDTFLNGEGKTQINYLFLFRNISPPAGNQAERVIEFWKTLINHWGARQAKLLQHKIYAFVIDGNCKLSDPPLVKSDREDDYCQLLQADTSLSGYLQLMPVVKPLQASAVRNWEHSCFPQQQFRYDNTTLDSILHHTGGWFRQTVLALGMGKLRLERNKLRMQAAIHQIIEKT